MGFLRQEYWIRLPFLSSGNLPDPGTEPESLTLQVDSLSLNHQGIPYIYIPYIYIYFSQIYTVTVFSKFLYLKTKSHEAEHFLVYNLLFEL